LNYHFLIFKMTISRSEYGSDYASGKIADKAEVRGADEVRGGSGCGIRRAESSGDFIVVNACDGVARVDTLTGEIRSYVVSAPKKKLRRYSAFGEAAIPPGDKDRHTYSKTRRTITGRLVKLVDEEEE
jgi:hypothetical protein